MIKKFFLLCFILLFFSLPVYASDYIAVATGCQQAVKNGETIILDKRDPTIYPIIKNERMFIPVRCIAELFGADVGWEAETQTVSIDYKGTCASFTIGEKNEFLGIDVPAFICEDAAFIPLRAAAESILGMNIMYFPETRTAVISDEEITEALGTDCYNLLCNYRVIQDDTHYIINNRRYKISGYVGSIPQIYYNYQMIDDKLKNDLYSLMQEVEFSYNTLTRNGDIIEKQGCITVNKSIADNVSEILYEIKEQGGILRQGDFGSFRISKTDFDDFGRMKHPNHPNGLAVDLNSVDNPYTYRENNGSITMLTDDSGATESYVFNENSAVVKVFEEYNWVWGGHWKGKYRDYMHFSLNGC